MRTLIFSDTHLTTAFDQHTFDALKKVIASVDRIIINGDFWDGYVISFDQFVTSEWKKIFPLLKEKKAVYLYGNHDPEKWADTRVSLFSDSQGDTRELDVGHMHVIVEHGHRVDRLFSGSHRSWWARVISYAYSFIETLEMRIFHNFPRYFGIDKRIIQLQLKHYADKKADDQELYIFGHCHIPVYDLDKNIAITGAFRYGFANYIIIDDVEIHPYLERYYDYWV